MNNLDYNSHKKIQDMVKKTKEGSNISYGNILEILSSIYNPNLRGYEEKSREEKEGHYYDYIPYAKDTFVKIILELQKKYQKKNFIDVGCGIGDKVILAQIFGDFERVTGIELNTTTFHVAKYFIKNRKLPYENFTDFWGKKDDFEKVLLNIDAFDYDFSNDDFIYMYVPISNNEIMKKLHTKILKEMSIGGIIIDVGANYNIMEILKEMKGVNLVRKERKRLGRRRDAGYFIKTKENEFKSYEKVWYKDA